jgi:hypothetical protein
VLGFFFRQAGCVATPRPPAEAFRVLQACRERLLRLRPECAFVSLAHRHSTSTPERAAITAQLLNQWFAACAGNRAVGFTG